MIQTRQDPRGGTNVSRVLLARRPDENRELSKSGAMAILRPIREATPEGA
jgi:hypothetical protein